MSTLTMIYAWHTLTPLVVWDGGAGAAESNVGKGRPMPLFTCIQSMDVVRCRR